MKENTNKQYETNGELIKDRLVVQEKSKTLCNYTWDTNILTVLKYPIGMQPLHDGL